MNGTMHWQTLLGLFQRRAESELMATLRVDVANEAEEASQARYRDLCALWGRLYGRRAA